MDMPTTEMVTDDDFAEKVLRADPERRVAILFWAAWCGPCRKTIPIFADLAQQHGGQVTFYMMNVDENRTTPPLWKVRGIPHVVVFQGGKVAGQQVGAHPKHKLESMILGLPW